MDWTPLFLLWAFGKQCAPSSSSPAWPNTSSPPPPPPLPQPPLTPSSTPVPPSAETGTPLADLAEPAQDFASKVRSEAERVVRKNLGLKKKPKPKPAANALPAFLDYAPPSYDVSVADLQKVLIRRGYKAIKKDGLYGPKTELAWKALATGKRLPAAIVRLAPKIARVNKETFATLSAP